MDRARASRIAHRARMTHTPPADVATLLAVSSGECQLRKLRWLAGSSGGLRSSGTATDQSAHDDRLIDRAPCPLAEDFFPGDAGFLTGPFLPHRRAPNCFKRCKAVGLGAVSTTIFRPRFPKSNFTVGIFSLPAIRASAFRQSTGSAGNPAQLHANDRAEPAAVIWPGSNLWAAR